jgi:hypothetical protein
MKFFVECCPSNYTRATICPCPSTSYKFTTTCTSNCTLEVSGCLPVCLPYSLRNPSIYSAQCFQQPTKPYKPIPLFGKPLHLLPTSPDEWKVRISSESVCDCCRHPCRQIRRYPKTHVQHTLDQPSHPASTTTYLQPKQLRYLSTTDYVTYFPRGPVTPFV